MTGLVVAPGDGLHMQAGPTRPAIKIGPHNGGHSLGVMESEIPPGGGFPAHIHDDYEEAFFVLAGEIDYFISDEWTTAGPGSTVFVPSLCVHGFRNSTDDVARHLAIASPADAMTMIEELFKVSPDEWNAVLGRFRSRLAPRLPDRSS